MQAQMYTEQTMRVSPTLIMVNQLLALSSLELQHMVHTEIEQNPALESVESTTCTSCGAGTTGLYCPVCMQPVYPAPTHNGAAPHSGDSPNGTLTDDGYDIEDYRPRDFSFSASEYEDFDPLTLVANEANMAEQLLAD